MTIVPEGFVETVAFTGARRIGTLGGQITLEQNAGRLVVRDITGQVRTQQDVEGFKVNGVDGEELVRIDQYGFGMNDGNNDRIIIGNEPGGF